MTKDTITAKATGVFAELMSTSKPDRCVAIIEEALTEIATLARKEGREEVKKQYADIFAWLFGEKGDFPNLAEKPHYRFRTELRERLKALTN